jgi:hypothetical protein
MKALKIVNKLYELNNLKFYKFGLMVSISM